MKARYALAVCLVAVMAACCVSAASDDSELTDSSEASSGSATVVYLYAAQTVQVGHGFAVDKMLQPAASGAVQHYKSTTVIDNSLPSWVNTSVVQTADGLYCHISGTAPQVVGKYSGTVWFNTYSDSGSYQTYSLEAAITVSGDAAYTYAVNYYYPDASTSTVNVFRQGASSTVFSGTDLTHVFTITDYAPLKVGYGFLGWNTSANTAIAAYRSGDLVRLSASNADANGVIELNLYPAYVQVTASSYTYTVAFDANGGTGAPSGLSYVTSETSHIFTLPTDTPTRTGYLFSGWYFTPDSTAAVNHAAGSSLTMQCTMSDAAGNVVRTLYAGWTIDTNYTEGSYTYTLEYDANNGTGAPERVTRTVAAAQCTFTVATDIPTRENYVFIGWAASASADYQAWQAGDTVTLLSTQANASGVVVKTLYAVWVIGGSSTEECVYRVIYNANGGTGAPSYQELKSTALTVAIRITDATPTWDGHTFSGWSDSSDGDIQYHAGDTITLERGNTLSKAVTLYAVWDGGNHTIIPTWALILIVVALIVLVIYRWW